MPSPFPGMDPYLEDPDHWPGIHVNLISGIQGQLSAQLRPKYFVRIEERVYITDESDEGFQTQPRIPDVFVANRTEWDETSFSPRNEGTRVDVSEPVVAITWFEQEIHEALLKIVDAASRDVVTVIEVLSPANKVPNSSGRKSFEDKRTHVMRSSSHWVEIDLLRGNRIIRVPKKLGSHSYLVHVSKNDRRPLGLLYPISLPQPLPIIPIPLKAGDPDAQLDIRAVIDAFYDRLGYDLEIDYRAEPTPPLSGKSATWANQLLRSKGLR
jgi:hypothetical protein